MGYEINTNDQNNSTVTGCYAGRFIGDRDDAIFLSEVDDVAYRLVSEDQQGESQSQQEGRDMKLQGIRQDIKSGDDSNTITDSNSQQIIIETVETHPIQDLLTSDSVTSNAIEKIAIEYESQQKISSIQQQQLIPTCVTIPPDYTLKNLVEADISDHLHLVADAARALGGDQENESNSNLNCEKPTVCIDSENKIDQCNSILESSSEFQSSNTDSDSHEIQGNTNHGTGNSQHTDKPQHPSLRFSMDNDITNIGHDNDNENDQNNPVVFNSYKMPDHLADTNITNQTEEILVQNCQGQQSADSDLHQNLDNLNHSQCEEDSSLLNQDMTQSQILTNVNEVSVNADSSLLNLTPERELIVQGGSDNDIVINNCDLTNTLRSTPQIPLVLDDHDGSDSVSDHCQGSTVDKDIQTTPSIRVPENQNELEALQTCNNDLNNFVNDLQLEKEDMKTTLESEKNTLQSEKRSLQEEKSVLEAKLAGLSQKLSDLETQASKNAASNSRTSGHWNNNNNLNNNNSGSGGSRNNSTRQLSTHLVSVLSIPEISIISPATTVTDESLKDNKIVISESQPLPIVETPEPSAVTAARESDNITAANTDKTKTESSIAVSTNTNNLKPSQESESNVNIVNKSTTVNTGTQQTQQSLSKRTTNTKTDVPAARSIEAAIRASLLGVTENDNVASFNSQDYLNALGLEPTSIEDDSTPVSSNSSSSSIETTTIKNLYVPIDMSEDHQIQQMSDSDRTNISTSSSLSSTQTTFYQITEATNYHHRLTDRIRQLSGVSTEDFLEECSQVSGGMRGSGKSTSLFFASKTGKFTIKTLKVGRETELMTKGQFFQDYSEHVYKNAERTLLPRYYMVLKVSMKGPGYVISNNNDTSSQNLNQNVTRRLSSSVPAHRLSVATNASADSATSTRRSTKRGSSSINKTEGATLLDVNRVTTTKSATGASIRSTSRDSNPEQQTVETQKQQSHNDTQIGLSNNDITSNYNQSVVWSSNNTTATTRSFCLVIMPNVFHSDLPIHQKYDLKGSLHNRKTGNPNSKTVTATSTVKNSTIVHNQNDANTDTGPSFTSELLPSSSDIANDSQIQRSSTVPTGSPTVAELESNSTITNIKSNSSFLDHSEFLNYQSNFTPQPSDITLKDIDFIADGTRSLNFIYTIFGLQKYKEVRERQSLIENLGLNGSTKMNQVVNSPNDLLSSQSANSGNINGNSISMPSSEFQSQSQSRKPSLIPSKQSSLLVGPGGRRLSTLSSLSSRNILPNVQQFKEKEFKENLDFKEKEFKEKDPHDFAFKKLKLAVQNSINRNLINQAAQADAQFLCRHRLMDYSLLIGIHFYPEEHIMDQSVVAQNKSSSDAKNSSVTTVHKLKLNKTVTTDSESTVAVTSATITSGALDPISEGPSGNSVVAGQSSEMSDSIPPKKSLGRVAMLSKNYQNLNNITSGDLVSNQNSTVTGTTTTNNNNVTRPSISVRERLSAFGNSAASKTTKTDADQEAGSGAGNDTRKSKVSEAISMDINGTQTESQTKSTVTDKIKASNADIDNTNRSSKKSTTPSLPFASKFADLRTHIVPPTSQTSIWDGGIDCFHSLGGKQRKCRIFIGIVDILQTYDLSKWSETLLKSNLLFQKSISSVDPTIYSQRFCDFLDAKCFRLDGSVEGLEDSVTTVLDEKFNEVKSLCIARNVKDRMKWQKANKEASKNSNSARVIIIGSNTNGSTANDIKSKSVSNRVTNSTNNKFKNNITASSNSNTTNLSLTSSNHSKNSTVVSKKLMFQTEKKVVSKEKDSKVSSTIGKSSENTGKNDTIHNSTTSNGTVSTSVVSQSTMNSMNQNLTR